MSGLSPAARSWRWTERNVVNPIVKRVLRSPLHGIVSDWLMLLSYEGRRSGSRYTTPVAYERDGPDIVVTTFRDQASWWRNFQDGHPARLWIRGEPVDAEGTAEVASAEVADWLDVLMDRNRTRLLGLFGLDAASSREEIADAASDLVVVRFVPE